MSKAKRPKDLLERMKTVAARRGTAPGEQASALVKEENLATEAPEVRRRVRITVDLDPEMHRFLKVYAAERGMKVSEVIRKLIRSIQDDT